MPEFQQVEPIELFLIGNVKSAGLASCPLGVSIEEIVHFVVDAL